MAPDSNTLMGFGPLWSSRAGILEFGFTATKPPPNWSPSPIRISQASYSAPLWPRARSSSSIIVTFTPFGVPSEYSCSGWRPTGSSFSCVDPAIGRLMFSNLPPLGLFQLHTLGGVYSGVSVIPEAPGMLRGARGQRRERCLVRLFGGGQVRGRL